MGLIYLDSCIVIYATERDPDLYPLVREAMLRLPNSQFVVSALVKMECLIKPIRSGNVALQRHFEMALSKLEMLNLGNEVYEQATLLRARHNLKTPDALHLACAQYHGCDALWTNDDRLAIAGKGLARSLKELQ
jgi:uncharacterized protein